MIATALPLFGIVCIVLAAHASNARVRRPSSGPVLSQGRSRTDEHGSFGGSE